MKVSVRGEPFEFERVDLRGSKMDGYCDPPDRDTRKIVVHSLSKKKNELRLILHELLHAAHWDIDETVVDQVSRDFAAILWRLGYRKVQPCQK